MTAAAVDPPPDPRWETGEMHAAYAHVEVLIARADSDYHGAPLWHGWALREAFLAGAKWQREAPSSKGGAL